MNKAAAGTASVRGHQQWLPEVGSAVTACWEACGVYLDGFLLFVVVPCAQDIVVLLLKQTILLTFRPVYTAAPSAAVAAADCLHALKTGCLRLRSFFMRDPFEGRL